ncbi:50S ribosomal protein L17 [Patescibacteria group bacterium]|nr:50S ribosomal protein L17 [Patescibacteria group bacterium]
MRHRKSGKKLGRNHHQRQALFKSLVRAIFTHSAIQTTKTKAKAVSPLIERICTKIKKADLSSKRFLYRYLQDRKWVKRVEDSFLKVFPDRNSNFLKISKIKRRQGDDATIVKLAFVKTISFKPEKAKEEKVNKKQARQAKAKSASGGIKRRLNPKNLLGFKNKHRRGPPQVEQAKQAPVGMKKKTSESELTRRGKSK